MANDTPAAPPSDLPGAGAGWRLEPGYDRLRTPRGALVPLTRAERDVLRLLMATRGHEVPRAVLIAGITDDPEHFDPHRLEMLVHRLREKILNHSGERLPLRAVRGAGYVLLQ